MGKICIALYCNNYGRSRGEIGSYNRPEAILGLLSSRRMGGFVSLGNGLVSSVCFGGK